MNMDLKAILIVTVTFLITWAITNWSENRRRRK